MKLQLGIKFKLELFPLIIGVFFYYRIPPATSPPENQVSDQELTPILVQNLVQSPSLNCHESGYDSAPSPNSPAENVSSPEKNSNSKDLNSVNESKAMVVHRMDMEEAFVMVPARKSKRVESVGQRRIRRPFSVAEVEALVQAVEKLGTGRCVLYFIFFPKNEEKKRKERRK
jgi:hypothetical protein